MSNLLKSQSWSGLSRCGLNAARFSGLYVTVMCPTPRPPCAALLTLPSDPWAPISSAEMSPTPLDYLICSRLSPHPMGLSHQPLISFLESSVCLSYPPARSPSSLRIKSMTHSSWGWWGSLVGVRDTPLPSVSSSTASVEPLTALRGAVPTRKQGQPSSLRRAL